MIPRSAPRVQAPAAVPAPGPARSLARSLAEVLASPRARLGAGTAAVTVTALVARHRHAGRWEAGAFRAVNGLPARRIRSPGHACSSVPSEPRQL